MSVMDTLVTDRTAADVALVKQLAGIGYDNMTTAQKNQWASNLKGAYNNSDLNRVGEAINYLVAELNDRYYYTWNLCDDLGVGWDEYWTPEHWDPNWHFLSITARTDWGASGIPQADTLTTLLAQVYEVTSMILLLNRLLPTSMAYLTYEGANQIETALLSEHIAVAEYSNAMNDMVNNTQKGYYYSGELYGGEAY